MLIGEMEVLTDQETKTLLWKKGDTLFNKNCDLKTESFEL